MAPRKEDFFKSAIGSQAAVMNAWMLLHRDSTWTVNDIQAAIPEIDVQAIEGHLVRLAGRHATRGGFLLRTAPGVFRVNPEKSPV